MVQSYSCIKHINIIRCVKNDLAFNHCGSASVACAAMKR